MFSYTLKPLFTPPTPQLRFLPEGVQLLHDSSEPSVGWVAIQHGATAGEGSLNFLNLLSLENRSYNMPGRPGFFLQTETPRVFIVGLTDKVCQVDLRGESPKFSSSLFAISPDSQRHIINDGVATSVGVLFGTKAIKWLEHDAELYLIPYSNPRVLTLAKQLQCSNGIVELGVTNSDLVASYIDSPTKKVVEILVNSKKGSFEIVRTIADFSHEEAFPDGQRAAPGTGPVSKVVVAFFNPNRIGYGKIREIDLVTGKVTGEWLVPGAARITCLTFVPGEPLGGGRNSVMIVATTADEGMPEDYTAEQPHRGALFVGETPYRLDEIRSPFMIPDAIFC